MNRLREFVLDDIDYLAIIDALQNEKQVQPRWNRKYLPEGSVLRYTYVEPSTRRTVFAFEHESFPKTHTGCKVERFPLIESWESTPTPLTFETP